MRDVATFLGWSAFCVMIGAVVGLAFIAPRQKDARAEVPMPRVEVAPPTLRATLEAARTSCSALTERLDQTTELQLVRP